MKLPIAWPVLFACLTPSTPVWGQVQLSKELASLQLIPADLEDAEKTFSLHDTDRDGALSADEWKHVRWKGSSGWSDLSGDGYLSHLEMVIMLAQKRRDTDVDQIDRTVAHRTLTRRDSNRNGQLDPEEISPSWLDQPEEVDLNGDGVLTLEELTVSFAEWRLIREQTGILGVDQGWAIKLRNRFDTNQDGGLDAQERASFAWPLPPDQFDRDQNQRLGLLELATLFAKHRRELNLAANDQLQIRNVFRRLDQNFDGVVDVDERSDYSDTDGKVIELLQAWDLNQDGLTVMSEAEKYRSKEREQLGYSDADVRNARDLLARQDRNRDGKLTRDEMKDESTPGYLDAKQFPNVDLNEDQQVDREELAKHFARARTGG